MPGALFALTLATCLGCGLAGGVFFAFSAFVMKALGRLPAAQGIAAMQSVNAAAVSPAFMTALLGTGAASAALAIWSALRWQQPDAPYLLAGGGLYLAGVIAVTAAWHVPRNTALDAVPPDSPGAPRLWDRYRRSWTAGNHVRAATAIAAAAALSIALTRT
jgi:uncharacterized membrane protein